MIITSKSQVHIICFPKAVESKENITPAETITSANHIKSASSMQSADSTTSALEVS
jgi:hypothetical protein